MSHPIVNHPFNTNLVKFINKHFKVKVESTSPNLEEQKSPTENKLDVKTTVKLFVTGFGPFGPSVKLNPTQLHIQNLEMKLLKGDVIHPSIDIQRLKVVDVDIQHCNEECQIIYDKIIEDIEANSDKSPFGEAHKIIYVIINMGVAAHRADFCFENRAKNIMDFSIPDMAKNQPRDEPICVEYDKSNCLFTGLDIEYLCKSIPNKHGLSIVQSEDAGEYICNYMYYRNLEKAELVNSIAAKNNHSWFGGCTAMFIHFPAVETVAEAKQQDFLQDALSTIANSF